MIEINKNLDGTLEKAIRESSKLQKKPGFLQTAMLAGDFATGIGKKVDTSEFTANNTDSNVQNYVSQLAGLNKSQQSAVLKMTQMDDAVKYVVKDFLNLTNSGKDVSASLIESTLSSNGFSDSLSKQVLEAAKLVDAQGNYLVVNKETAQQNLESALRQKDFTEAVKNTKQTEQQLASTIIATVLGQQAQTGATQLETFAVDALAGALAIAKQAAIGLGIGFITWVGSNIVNYILNLKSASEQLVDAMNDSHDAADQAAQDVEDIQSKIDDLNKSVKEAGAEKIEDIVDPAERERLQAINDMLEAQLELKKQISKDADDKANTDTSAVVNDKSENSIVKFSTQPQVSYDSNGNPITIFSPTPDKVTKTESLQEYTAALEDTTQKRRDLQVELDQIEASSGKDSKEYANKKKELDALNETFESQKTKVEELSTAVSEQMGNYKTDADSFAKYKDEYVAGTNAMTAATKALANAQDDTSVDTTNVDIFAEKVSAVKASMSRRGTNDSKGNSYVGAVNEFSGMTGDAVLNIDADTEHQTEAESNALKILHETADKAHISFGDLIGVFEQFGFLQVSNAEAANNYASQLEETMGVIDNIQSAYKNCSTAVEEYNKYGYLSIDSLQSLLQMDDAYLNTLELVNGKLQVNQSAYADLLATQYAEAQMEAISQAISELNAIAKKDAAEKAETFTEATEDEKNKLEALAPALKNATIGTGELAGALAAARSAENGDNTEEIEEKISSVMTALNTRLSLISTNMNNAMNSASGLKNQLNGFSDSTNNSSKAAQTFLDAWSTVTSAMKEFNEQGYLTMQTVQSLTGLEDKYSSVLQKNDTTGKLEIQTAKFKELMEAELKDAKIKGDNASATQYNKILKWTNRNIKDQTMSYWDLVAAIEGYSAALSGAKEITDGFKDAQDNGKTVKEKTEKSRTGALDYEGTEAQSAALQSIKKYSEYDPDLINKAYNKDTGKIDLSGDVLKDAVVKSLEAQAEAASSEGGAASEAIVKSYKIAANNIKNDVISVQDYFDGLGSTVEEFSSKIDDMQSAWTDLSDVANEYNTYGGLSIDSIQKLLTMSPEYLQFLKLEGNQLVFNKEAMLAKTKADILAKAAELELKEETKDQAEILRALADSLDKGADSMEGMGKSADKLKTLMSQLNTVLNSFIGVFDDLNDKQSNDLKIQGEAWIDVIDKRIDALNEENDAQERAIELAKLQDEYERAKANKTVHVYGGRGQGFVWKADENAVREAGQNLSDKQREYKKQDEIDKLEKLKDKVQETNNLIGTSWDDYQKKLKYTAEFEAMTFEQMEGHYDGFKGSILNNMQAIQGATNVKNVITDISNLISTLETLANILNLLNGGSGDGGGVFGFINQIKNMFTGENGDFDLGGGFKKMFDGAAKVVSDGWNWITGKNRAGSAALKSDTTATLDILGNTIKVNTGDIQRVSGGFFERLVGAAKDNLGSIGKFFSGAQTSISEKTGLMFGDIGSFFTEGFGLLNSQTGLGLGGIVETVGSMFGPIAAGAQSIGSAISSGVVSFFPSIFAGLGTLVTSVGSAMAAMMQAIAAALSSIPIAGWIAAAAAVAGAVALIATIASIASNVSSTQVDEPTPAFQAKKYAKGTRGVKKGQIANVDEKGEELIVRNPDQGRMTYLEKGDGVIPAKETDNLMAIGANPEGWLAKGLAEMTGSAAAGAGMSAKGPNAQLSGAAAAAAAGVGSVFKDEYDEILGDTNEFMSGLSDIFKKSDNPIIAAIQSMFYFVNKTAYRMSTVGKINSSKTVTESTSNTKKAAQSQISSMTSNFESSWKSVAGELGLDTKDIEATSKKMSEKMNELVNNTFDALNENTGLSAEQVEDVTNTMFDSLQKIYTSGWNSLASTSGDMSEEIAKKLNASYKSSVDSTNKAMNEISKAFGHSWNKVGGGVKTLSTNVQKTMEQAWADTSKDTQKLMYDMRACFDNSWSMNEAGVTNLAEMTQGTVKDGYAEIDSSSSNTFGENGQLKTDADNSWKNVEPGATNLANNMQWVMDQSYNAIKAGCTAAVTSIKNDLATTGDAFEAVATKAEKAKQETQQQQQTAQQPAKQKGALENIAEGAGQFIRGVGQGIADVVTAPFKFLGSLLGFASGTKEIKKSNFANVDEQGPEMLVRKPDSGRYTYLETGDGVVPADITSKLFEMGGNPDAWFQKQMSKYGSQPIVQGGGGDVTTSIGDIIITNPVGSSDALANEIKQKLPTKVAQMQSKR